MAPFFEFYIVPPRKSSADFFSLAHKTFLVNTRSSEKQNASKKTFWFAKWFG